MVGNISIIPAVIKTPDPALQSRPTDGPKSPTPPTRSEEPRTNEPIVWSSFRGQHIC